MTQDATFDRRSYLKAVGALGVSGAFVAASGSATAQFQATGETYNYIEAESAAGQDAFAPFTVGSDESALSGSYIEVPNSEPEQRGSPENGRTGYEIDVPSDDEYVLWARVRPQRYGTSAYLSIDGDSPAEWSVPPQYGTWSWAEYGDLSLSAGTHTVELIRRESGLDIDRLLVTSDADFVPTDTGGPARTDVDSGFSGSDSGGNAGDRSGGTGAIDTDGNESDGEQSPYGGVPTSLPGRLETENFDEGGEGVAYHDTESENKLGAYRPDEGVDIAETDDASGKYNLGYVEDGEWLEYTVALDGDVNDYDVALRVAGKNANAQARVLLDGSVLATFDVPDTNGWQDWTTLTRNVGAIDGGERTLRLEMVGGSFNLNWIEFADASTDDSDSDTRVEAENFDTGGEGVAYSDTDSKNRGGAYRDTGVDIQSTSDDSGYNVGWTNAGEWLEYTVAVSDSDSGSRSVGTYDIDVRTASARDGGELRVLIDDTAVGTLSIPGTDGWQSWTTTTLSGVDVSDGEHVVRLEIVRGGFNIGWFRFVDSASNDSGDGGDGGDTGGSPPSDGTYTAVKNGWWGDGSTWKSGVVPADGATVSIPASITVALADESARIKYLVLSGTLAHAPNRDTKLRVETLESDPGSRYQIGTATEPIAPDTTATVEVIDEGPMDLETWPGRRGKGLLVKGDLKVHGAETTPWTTLDQHPTVGDRSVTLSGTPTNWKTGDELVFPGTGTYESADLTNGDEKRTITSVDGRTISVDTPLEHDHVPPKAGLESYVLNLSRNVVFRSENTAVPRRGHVMVMSQATSVAYARFDGLGRTDKSSPITNPVRGKETLPDGLAPNPAARYSLHWHHTGIDGAEPHTVEGAVVTGSPGWGIVNHHSYAHVTDSITYDVFGAGFVAEGGNERGSFERCFALRSEGSGERIDSRSAGESGHAGGDPKIDDFGHAGHGFWLQSPLVECVDNVAAGHRHYAFVLWLRPLLEGHMAECSDVPDSRVSYCPNLPLRYVDGQERLLEAIGEGRFSNYDGLMRETGKVPSTFVRVRKFKDNTAFGSAGGLDLSRHNFKWKHENYGEFSAIDGLTVYDVGPHIDGNGEKRGVIKRGNKKGGNQAIKLRYCSNIAVRNCRLFGSDDQNGNATGNGLSPHDYLWTVLAENNTVEGFGVGLRTGEHRLTHVRDNAFAGNGHDMDWVVGNTGPLIAENNGNEDGDATLLYDFSYGDVKAPELFGRRQVAGAMVDGRTAYFDEQAPDYVPVKSKEHLADFTQGGGYGQMDRVVENPEAVIGKTNAELEAAFGICLGGHLLPGDAEDDARITSGRFGPPSRVPPTTVRLNAVADASMVGDGFELVSEPEAATGECLRATGTISEPTDGTGADAVSFDFECAAGTYYLYARLWTDSWNGDTFYYRIDGAEWQAAPKLKPPAGFEWHEAAERNGPPHEIDLDAGSHTIDIALSNGAVLFDSALLTSDATVVGGR